MNRQKHKILIADHNLDLLRKIRNAPVAKQYHFEVAHDGIACLTKIESFLPDLIILDAYLPKIHGIEILRKVKTDPRTKHVGVIFTCFYPLIQFYRPAIALSVDFFLPKGRMPDPASKMIISDPFRISKQVVLPPKCVY